MHTSITNVETLFDLGKLTNYLVTKWKWFIALGFSFAIVFALISINLPDEYTSEILLADADSTSGDMGGIAGQLGGLASIAGININSGKNKKLIALQIFESRKFLVDFVKDNKIEALLFAVESWDNTEKQFIYDEGKFNVKTKEWLPRPGLTISYYPTDLEIHLKMKSLLEVDVDKTNKVTRMWLTYYHPQRAQQWLGMLVEKLNNSLRQTELDEKEAQISFLQQELNLEKNSEIRNVFYSLIEEQLKSSTLAKARNEYIFRIIDPAIYPENPSAPKKALITILGGLVGGVFCFVIFTIRFIFKREV